MRIKAQGPLAFLGFLSAATLLAQDFPLPSGSISIKFPDNSPVALSSSVTNESRATARGAAMALDLHMALLLRNVSAGREIHGVTLRVVAQELTLGGKGSVAYPSLRVGPGETFPVRIDMQLLRPTQAAAGPLVQVELDGVLFSDLSFVGPNLLNSKRTMTAWEQEAQRDRAYFKAILRQGGADALRAAVMDSLARQAERPRLDARVTRGRAVTTAALPASAERVQRFAFLTFPDSPVAPIQGQAVISGNEVRNPQVEVRNQSGQPVKYVELGFLVEDPSGANYLAASLPASDPDFRLRPGAAASVLQDTALRFSRNGRPVNVQGMTGFVSQVEFMDGKVWVPNRESLANAHLLRILAPSAEEERLTDLYRKKGIDSLVQELQKY